MFYIQIYVSFRLVLLLKWCMSLIHDHATLNNFHISNYGHQILTNGEPLGEDSIALSAIFTADVIIVSQVTFTNLHIFSYGRDMIINFGQQALLKLERVLKNSKE